MKSLQQDFGYLPSTPLKESLRETINYLLNSGNNHESPDYSLNEIEAELESGGGNSYEVLTKYAANKDRTPIDLRMNTDPPVYPNIAGTVTV